MNNKMKKFNKILMMTVAILLTLVLASTSVVSGIFAKYVVTKKATATVSLQKFGLELKVEAGSGVSATPIKAGEDTIAITINSLELLPGDNKDQAIKFTISGTSNVAKVNLKVVTNVVSYTPVYVPAKIGGLETQQTYLPIEFTAKVENTAKVLYEDWQQPTAGDTIQSKIAENIRNAFDDNDSTGDVAIKEIVSQVNKTSNTTSLCFGFKWDKASANIGTGLSSDEIGTYIAEHDTGLEITYIVSLEQG